MGDTLKNAEKAMKHTKSEGKNNYHFYSSSMHSSVLAVMVRIDAPVFPLPLRGRQLHYDFRGYIWVRSRCDP